MVEAGRDRPHLPGGGLLVVGDALGDVQARITGSTARVTASRPKTFTS